jgi:hypothetical protein
MELGKFFRKVLKVSVIFTLLALVSMGAVADRNNPAGETVYLATLSSPTDSTHTFNGGAYDYSFYCSGGTVTFACYVLTNRRGDQDEYSLVQTITLLSGLSWSTNSGPRIDRVIINRPDSIPVVLFSAEWGSW